jgi:hypothetical protein
VHWCVPPYSEPAAGDVTALARKRFAFWNNATRNDFIATVARAFSEADEQALWACGLLLAGGGITLTGRPAVTVLVESAEHARELLRRLPGWEVLDAVPKPPGGRPSFPIHPFKLRPLDRVIVTALAAARLEVVDTDLVLRAGPESPLELPGFPPRSVGPRRLVLLVDVADDGDGLARAAVGRRLRDYAGRGWASVGVPAWAAHDGGEVVSRRARGAAR